jgi:stalled ribosome rescue protein Dom34
LTSATTQAGRATRPEKIAGVHEGSLDTDTPVDMSIKVNETTNKEKERQKRWTAEEEKELVSVVETFGTTSWAEIAFNVPGRSKGQCIGKWQYLSKMAAAAVNSTWTVEEENELVFAVETYGTTSWAKIARKVPGRSENQCSSKWRDVCRKTPATDSGLWTVEEENELVFAVETYGTTSWAKIAGKVPGRNKKQCYDKWRKMSRKAAATSTGPWTVEEEKKLASGVETFGTSSWAKIAENVPARTESQCYDKWRSIRMSRKAAATTSGAWTVEEENDLVSAIANFGACNWARIAAIVQGRNERQCYTKWRNISGKAIATATGAWTAEEENKLVSAVATYGGRNWAIIAENVPARNESQCRHKWRGMSRKAAATSSGAWTVEEENKLVFAVDTFGSHKWAKIAANVPGRNETQCSNKWWKITKKAAATSSGASIAATVPGRNEKQCYSKWQSMSRGTVATASSAWTVEEEWKLVSAVATYGDSNWAEIAKMVPGRNDRQCHLKWKLLSETTAATAIGLRLPT